MITYLFLFLLFFLPCTQTLCAHEPLFGFGPELIRQGGCVIENEVEHERAGNEKETMFESHIMYGVTEYLSMVVAMPFFLNKAEIEEIEKTVEIKSIPPILPAIVGTIDSKIRTTKQAAGLGKIETLAKLRVYHDYQYGKRDQVVAIAGIKWPTVASSEELALENKAVDFVVGLAAGREALKKSFFGAAAYTIKTNHKNFKEGDELNLTLSAGFRPLRVNFYKLDFMFFLEFDGVFTARDQKNGTLNQNSGGHTIFMGPVAIITRNNVALKAGIQAPIIERLNGEHQHHHDFRFAVGLDFHF